MTTPYCTVGYSRWKMLSTETRPMPLSWKVCSTMTTPPMRAPVLTAAAVTRENNDGRSVCPNRMRFVLRPLARAVVMKSLCSVAMRSARRSRM